jgi:hypothetical protein
MAAKQTTAFITTRRGSCYLTVKYHRRNVQVLRIRNYTLDAQDKRDLRRLYPEVDFDWEKIAHQLAEKREACRRYRSRRRSSAAARRARAGRPFYAAYDPFTRTVYADEPANAREAGALLDAVLSFDRMTGLPLLPPKKA